MSRPPHFLMFLSLFHLRRFAIRLGDKFFSSSHVIFVTLHFLFGANVEARSTILRPLLLRNPSRPHAYFYITLPPRSLEPLKHPTRAPQASHSSPFIALQTPLKHPHSIPSNASLMHPSCTPQKIFKNFPHIILILWYNISRRVKMR